MGRISSGVGLISGINSKDIIDQLMALEARPKDRLQTRIEETNKQKLAYTDLSTRLTSLKLVGTKLKKPSTFEASQTNSTNEDVLTATASNGAAEGSYTFHVARLVTSHQSISRGFESMTAKPGASTLTIEQGGGELTAETPLSQLNGGAGVRRGKLRITDRSGSSELVDISGAVTLDDAVKKINTSLSINVRASISGDRIVVSDLTNRTTSRLIISDVDGGSAATDLGIVASVSANTVTGTDINYIGNSTKLSDLNDGRGIQLADAGADLQVTSRDGTQTDVDLGDAETIGDVINALNAAGAGQFRADFVAGANNIRLTNLDGGTGALSAASLNGSNAAKALGLETSVTANTLTGNQILADVNTVLVSSLKGGSGLSLGTISIKNRAGAIQSINLSAAKTVQGIITAINAAGAGVTAALKASGNGISIQDTTGGPETLIIDDVTGTSASDLGLLGTFDTDVRVVDGANLQRQWVTRSMPLSSYNGGKGVSLGKFKITNSEGISTQVDLSSGEFTNLGHVIDEINRRAVGVTAAVNANGDGIALTDSTTGSLKLTVEDESGTAAKDLGIVGVGTDAAPKSIDGSFERTIEIAATDTLADMQKKINDLGFGASASVLNDGTGASPFRLSLTARNTGRAGRVVFDAGASTLGTSTLVAAQDAAIFVGGTNISSAALVTSSSNSVTNVIKGVTLDLHGVSDQPVTLNVTRTADTVIEQLTGFVEDFNAMVDKIKELTKFDSETQERGLLLGETSIQKIQSEIYAILQGTVTGSAKFRIIADVGVRVGDGAKLEFDEEKFRAAFAEDPDAVKALFTTPEQGLSSRTLLNQLNDSKGVRVADSGNDFSIKLRDGTTLDISLARSETLGDILAAMNRADNTKLKAELSSTGAIKISDLTTGTGEPVITPANGSQAIDDLKLTGTGSGGVITGQSLGRIADARARGGGLGYIFENRISHLIDPVSGVITRANRTLDQKTNQFRGRIQQIDKLIESKRLRLERQFAQMETVLSSLQNQQQAIGQIQTIQLPSKK